MHKVSLVLEIKSEIGICIYNAYSNKDKNNLKNIIKNDLPKLENRVESLKDYHRSIWMKINKPAGWEILDLRYGALLARINTAIMRIEDYVDGNISTIDELEHERLPFYGIDGLVQCNTYNKMPSASRISITTFFMW
jgi:hypothetical protein